jgi:hypothetical protein
MKLTETEEPDILLIQEPYEYQNKPVGIENNRIFTAGTGKHRAAIIVINSKIDAILIAKLSDDTVILEIIYGKQKFYTAIMYFDYKEQIENKFHKMDEIMRFINGGRILIAADSNARSKTWYDVINSRGRKLEEYLASKHLHLINKESEISTFHNSRGSSNTDLTITNNNLLSDVSGREVSSEESLSDHNYLKYKIGAGVTNSHKKATKPRA